MICSIYTAKQVEHSISREMSTRMQTVGDLIKILEITLTETFSQSMVNVGICLL